MIARVVGCVVRTVGDTVLAALPAARIGDGVRIRRADGSTLAGEVASVEQARVSIAPFGTLTGVAVGDRVVGDARALAVPVGAGALGRAFDASGAPLDGGAWSTCTTGIVDRASALPPGARAPVSTVFRTGIRAIDGLLTIGRGARVGLFGAPGAGKTTLLEAIAAGASGDAVVIALVGERGREAQAWLARCDRRTTIVCATSDRSAAERVRAADVAMTQAEFLRDRGAHVVLIVDSLARYAAALRERHVALGEPVGRGGYPPSVWAELARYLERAGNGARGSITMLATVLADGADDREPLSDAARSLLDGHIVLSSALADKQHFPAIDVVASTSRTMSSVVSREHARAAGAVRRMLSRLAETSDARALGLAEIGDVELAAAVAAEPAIVAFLRQSEPAQPGTTLASLYSLAARDEAPR
ncbi:MAG: type III secretion system ATPase SctN [Vulcanimicrobiaceae bacterium]